MSDKDIVERLREPLWYRGASQGVNEPPKEYNTYRASSERWEAANIIAKMRGDKEQLEEQLEDANADLEEALDRLSAVRSIKNAQVGRLLKAINQVIDTASMNRDTVSVPVSVYAELVNEFHAEGGNDTDNTDAADETRLHLTRAKP